MEIFGEVNVGLDCTGRMLVVAAVEPKNYAALITERHGLTCPDADMQVGQAPVTGYAGTATIEHRTARRCVADRYATFEYTRTLII